MRAIGASRDVAMRHSEGAMSSTPMRPHPAMPNNPVQFDDVEVLEQTRLGLECRVGDRVVFAGNVVRLDGTTVASRGDVGRLVLPRWFVELHRIGGAGSDGAIVPTRRDSAIALSRATIADALEQQASAIRAMPLEQFARREARMRDVVMRLPDVG
jgi:hypothetical protein